MHDDPKHWRLIGSCLLVVCVVFLATRESVPWWWILITGAFYGWRWWEQRKRVGDWGSPWVYSLYQWIKSKLKRGKS
ncbi:MAG TPA: hypothetical protein VHC22_21910 [Pirellulales bacterium]|nr:hypothetical protein [Pirellulales bacterium]